MSVGGGKQWRRWRNVGAIMGKRFDAESELRKRFGQSGLSVKPEKSGNLVTPEIEPKAETGSITSALKVNEEAVDKHPRPWRLDWTNYGESAGTNSLSRIVDANGKKVVTIGSGTRDTAADEATAQLIVEAVNTQASGCHDAD